jgi:Hint domain
MASVTWTWTTGGGTGNWNTPADWSTKSVPVANDSVFITRSNTSAYTVTLDTSQPATGSYAALTVGSAQATLALSVDGTSLSVAGATTLSAGTINISNAATLATGTFLLNGGTITESQGLLSVTGTSATALSVTGGGSSFILSGGTVAVTGGASFTNGTETISGGAFNTGSLVVGSNASSARTLTLSGGITTVSGLTIINAGDSKGGSKIAMSGGSLAAMGGVSFAGNSNFGILTGNGTVSGGAISGNGTITASGGTLDIGNAISNGPTLTIATAAGSDLKIDGTVAVSPAIAITSANQTLEVGAAGALTIGAGESVISGVIKLDGGTLTDASGISFGSGATNGTLNGFGVVAANLTRIGSGAFDTITASGGTLEVTGTFGTGLVATIDKTSASDLRFDNTGTVSALSINDGNQTLEVHSGALTLTGAQTVSLGTILMSGGTLGDSSGIVLGSGTSAGSLTGAGTVSADIKKGGTSASNLVEASGGVLVLTGTIGVASGLSYQIADSTSSILELDGTVGAGNNFTFLGADGDLQYSQTGGISENIVGLNVGTSAVPTNFIESLSHTVTISGSNVHTGNSATVDLSDGSVLTLTGITNAPGTWFVNTQTVSGGSTEVFLSAVCYAAGTRILTATGERMVESLMRGDIVLTLAGGELIAQPVKWIGQRRIDLTAHPRPETVAPIRIRCGAFADNMPHSDLLLSPDHAVFVDGKLICARQLVNGTTIRQETGRTPVEYFHVELDAHAILLAEGLPAESYLNTDNRGFFANSGEPLVLHPDLTDETGCPAREAASCEPFAWDEASVLPVWQRLANRAAALGQPAPKPDTTADPELRIVAKGRTVRPLYGENRLYIFALPKGATEVRLVSRCGSPTDARPWLDDRRCLGVNVERIVLRSASELQEVPVDHPGLSKGWHAVERDGVALRRWTSGNAVLPLPVLGGPTMLEIRAGGGGMTYLSGGVQEQRAA